MGWDFLLQGIFLTQESNLGLLHYRQILYQLSYEGSPSSSFKLHFLLAQHNSSFFAEQLYLTYYIFYIDMKMSALDFPSLIWTLCQGRISFSVPSLYCVLPICVEYWMNEFFTLLWPLMTLPWHWNFVSCTQGQVIASSFPSETLYKLDKPDSARLWPKWARFIDSVPAKKQFSIFFSPLAFTGLLAKKSPTKEHN